MKREYVVVQVDSNGCIIKSGHHWRKWSQIHNIFHPHPKGDGVSVSIQDFFFLNTKKKNPQLIVKQHNGAR